MRIANLIPELHCGWPQSPAGIYQGCPHPLLPAARVPRPMIPPAAGEVECGGAGGGLDNPLLQGLTLSSGDPFFQAEECAARAGSGEAKGP